MAANSPLRSCMTPVTPGSTGSKSKKNIRFGQVVSHEHKVHVGGCGVPEHGGYPLTMTDEVVRRSVSELPSHDGSESEDSSAGGSPLAVKARMFGKKKQMKRKMRWALIPQFAPLTEKDRKKLVGGAAVKTTHDVSAIKAELNKIRAERAESMACSCVPSLPAELRKASITSLLNLAVDKKILPATDEAGNVMDKHKLLACLFVNDEPLASKSKADQRMVLCELLRDSSPKLCSEDTDCLCAKDGGPCGSSCPCAFATCANPVGTTVPCQPVNVVEYRKRIIQLTKKTGDLFSPAKLHKPLRKHAPSAVPTIFKLDEQSNVMQPLFVVSDDVLTHGVAISPCAPEVEEDNGHLFFGDGVGTLATSSVDGSDSSAKKRKKRKKNKKRRKEEPQRDHHEETVTLPVKRHKQ